MISVKSEMRLIHSFIKVDRMRSKQQERLKSCVLRLKKM